MNDFLITIINLKYFQFALKSTSYEKYTNCTYTQQVIDFKALGIPISIFPAERKILFHYSFHFVKPNSRYHLKRAHPLFYLVSLLGIFFIPLFFIFLDMLRFKQKGNSRIHDLFAIDVRRQGAEMPQYFLKL